MKNEKLRSKIKNLLLILTALVFAVGVLVTSVIRTSALNANKNDIAKQEVDYLLAYPGILPDHFLYPIKMIRDRIWLILTTDQVKRGELLLLFADKRIWSAQMLVEKGKVNLGVSTATKAEKYLERAVNQEKIAREKGKDTKAFLEKLSKATLKHEEVLLEINQKVPDTLKPVVNNALDYARRGYEQVMGRLKE